MAAGPESRLLRMLAENAARNSVVNKRMADGTLDGRSLAAAPPAARPAPVVQVPRPAGGGGGGRYPELVIASAASHPDVLAMADFVADESNDSTVFQLAVDTLWDQPWGGRLWVAAGAYDLEVPVLVRGNVEIVGSGRGTRITADTDAFHVSGHDAAIRDMTISANDYAIDVAPFSSPNHCFMSGIEALSAIRLGGRRWILEASTFIGAIQFSGSYCLAYGCNAEDGLVFTDSSFGNRASNILSQATIVDAVILDGQDNAVTECYFRAANNVDNAGQAVLVLGQRNNFTHNIVRSRNTARAAYGVKVDAAAVDARVKYNDLYPGQAPNSWGTAAFVDLGTGTRGTAADNDT